MHDLITSLTPQQWYLIGGLVAAGLGAIGITEWVKRHHFKVKAEKLWTGFVFINVTVWSFLLTAVDAISANIAQISHIGSLIPQVAPFVAHYAPMVTVIVVLLHTVVSVLYKWWVDRKNHVPISNVNMPDLSATVTAVTSTTTLSGNPSSSFGTASAGVDVVAPPPSDLFSA
jgi:hypothetical protein